MSPKHKAAVAPQKGERLTIVERDTPEPGPTEVLLQVKAIAVNPVDRYQRDYGFPPVPSYPSVFGCDVAAIVVKVGADVDQRLQLGSRVIAFASNFYQHGSLDHGAFQEYALAQAEAVTALPEHLSYEEGAALPLAALTALSGWTTIGIPLDTVIASGSKQAVLIWGASSSVGTLAVQSAKILGFVVYAVAGASNHDYMRQLGADAVFDHKDADVVTKIVEQAKRDGFSLTISQAIVDGSLQPVLDVLKQTKGDAQAKVAYAPVLPEDHPTIDGALIKFTSPPQEKTARDQHIKQCFNVWLNDALISGSVVPSPKIRKVDGGLNGINEALDILGKGVSAMKVVVTV